MVGIIDYKTGNLRSVENALYRAGVEYAVTAESAILHSCSHILLPGVGDAGWAMGRICENGIADIIATFTQPVMGICLGMQIMCSYSEESDTRCLGIFPGKIRRIPEKSMPDRRMRSRSAVREGPDCPAVNLETALWMPEVHRAKVRERTGFISS